MSSVFSSSRARMRSSSRDTSCLRPSSRVKNDAEAACTGSSIDVSPCQQGIVDFYPIALGHPELVKTGLVWGTGQRIGWTMTSSGSCHAQCLSSSAAGDLDHGSGMSCRSLRPNLTSGTAHRATARASFYCQQISRAEGPCSKSVRVRSWG